MKYLFSLILLCISLNGIAQSDTCHKKNTFFSGLISQNNDPSVYTAMQNIWFSNEKISYLAAPIFFNEVESTLIPLRQGEGQNGYLFEGNFLYQAPVLMGRNHGNHFWQTSRLTFDYGFNIRMTKDTSYPLIPNNNIVGFNIDKVLWDSHTRFNPFNYSTAHAFSDWNKLEKPLSNLSLNITAHHYSNGQPSGFFLRDTIGGQAFERNDYLEGDFSTNYLQLGLTFSHLFLSKSIASLKIAYQRDGNGFGPLVFSPEQINSYGQNRLLGFLQYRHVWRGLNKTKSVTVQSRCDECEPTADANLYKTYELLLRFEYEYIFGDMSNYPLTKAYRFNPHLFAKFTRPEWRAIGFIAHYYYGRDYSNIRYDLPISALTMGLSIDLNKYRAPFSDNQKFKTVNSRQRTEENR